MDFNNSFKCRMGADALSNVQFNLKLWNIRLVVKGTKDAVKLCSCKGTSGDVVGGFMSATR